MSTTTSMFVHLGWRWDYVESESESDSDSHKHRCSAYIVTSPPEVNSGAYVNK